MAYGQDALLATLSDWIEADEGAVERWRAVWPDFDEDAAVPTLESHAFGRLPRPVDEGKMAALAQALRQVVEVSERVRADEDELGQKAESRWLARRWSDGVPVDRREASPPEPGLVQSEISEAEAEALVGMLDRDGSSVEIDLVPANSVIQGEREGKPRMAACLLEVDATSGMS